MKKFFWSLSTLLVFVLAYACGTELGNPASASLGGTVLESSELTNARVRMLTTPSGLVLDKARLVIGHFKFYAKDSRGECDMTKAASASDQLIAFDLLANVATFSGEDTKLRVAGGSFCACTFDMVPFDAEDFNSSLSENFLPAGSIFEFKGVKNGAPYDFKDNETLVITFNFSTDLSLEDSSTDHFIYGVLVDFIKNSSLTGEVQNSAAIRAGIQKSILWFTDTDADGVLSSAEKSAANVLSQSDSGKGANPPSNPNFGRMKNLRKY